MTENPYKPMQPFSDGDSDDISLDANVLRYDVSFEDMMAFQKFHFSHSPTIRRQIYIQMLVGSLITTGFLLYFLDDVAFPTRLVFALCSAPLLSVLTYLFFRWSFYRQAAHLLKEGDNAGVMCEHELRLEDDFLIESTEVNLSRHAYTSIRRIEVTVDYVFVYLSAFQAHVIPRRSVFDGDVDLFVAKLKERASCPS